MVSPIQSLIANPVAPTTGNGWQNMSSIMGAFTNQQNSNQNARALDMQERQMSAEREQAAKMREINQAAQHAAIARSIALREDISPEEANKQQLRFLEMRASRLEELGRDPSDTRALMAMPFEDRQNELLRVGSMLLPHASGGVDGLLNMLGIGSGTPAGLRELQGIADKANLSPEEEEKLYRIAGGLEARASTSAQERIAQDPNLTADVASSRATIRGAESGAAESARLDAQLKQLPQVREAVKRAELVAQLAADRGEEGRLKSVTLNMYETAMKGLADSLAGTDTGPFAGRLPAVTSEQQIAEGSIAVIAPILKSMFRAAGEGVFTDKDQELLMNMVPKRTDTPEAVRAKIEMLDAVVRTKLSTNGAASSQIAQTPSRPQSGSNAPSIDDLVNQYAD